MTKVVLENSELVETLAKIEKRSTLCDATGRVLGYYVPNTSDRPLCYRGIKSPLSPEERERLIREEGPFARTLAEFWEEMRRKHPEKFQ